MTKRPLGPTEAASALLQEAGGDRRRAERHAWQQYVAFQAQDGDEHMSTRYWLTLWQVIIERQEQPPVPDAVPVGQKRFDATGQVVTDLPPPPTLGLTLSDTEH